MDTLEMSQAERIALETDRKKELIGSLNQLLADYSVFYNNTRGYHWNIKGPHFFELHAQFEDLYTDLFHKIDEIAERILTLGGRPEHAYSKYLNKTRVKESEVVTDSKEIVNEILDSFQSIIASQRELIEASAEAEDEGTNDMMTAYTREQEKKVWMYSAFLGK